AMTSSSGLLYGDRASLDGSYSVRWLERFDAERGRVYGAVLRRLAWVVALFHAIAWGLLLSQGQTPWFHHILCCVGLAYTCGLALTPKGWERYIFRTSPYVYAVLLTLTWCGFFLLGLPQEHESVAYSLTALLAVTAPILVLFFLMDVPRRALLAGCVLVLVLSSVMLLRPSMVWRMGLSGVSLSFVILFAYGPLLIMLFLKSHLTKTLQLALSKREHRYHTMLRYSSDIVSILDARGRVLFESPSAERLLGYRLEERRGRNVFLDVHPEDLPNMQAKLSSLLVCPGERIMSEMRIADGEGSWVEVECIAQNLLKDPDVRGIVVNTRDISNRKEHERRLDYLSRHDLLTKLPNRQSFLLFLDESLSLVREQGQELGLLVFNIDRFKSINETYGPLCGDLLLQRVAKRLLECSQDYAKVSRLGSDEFAFVLLGTDVHQRLLRFAELLVQEIQEPFSVSGHHIHVSASLGMACFPEHHQGSAQLLYYADFAMLDAKKKQLGYKMFSEELRQAWNERTRLHADLRRGIEREEFVLHYQPRVDLRSGCLHSFEALVRWQHPKLGLLYPDRFIRLAEDTGLIHALGEQVLSMACEQLYAWQSAGYNVSISVNLSTRQLQDTEIAQRILRTLERFSVEGRWVELEITESAAMLDMERTIQTLNCLKDSGIQISIDDFGTGYSALHYLRRLPVDYIKIDRSFVQNIANSAQTHLHDEAIVQAIVTIAHSLNMIVIAEGIEYEQQALSLRALKCEMGQGYLFGRPVSAEQAELCMREVWTVETSRPASTPRFLEASVG
ncbi:MAG: EAL domain-containing protein, partial [Myxococcota bacterium]